MTQVRFFSMPSEEAAAYWAGAPDANGQKPEVHLSDGDGVPCRHCQQDIAEGETYLILAYRPIDEPVRFRQGWGFTAFQVLIGTPHSRVIAGLDPAIHRGPSLGISHGPTGQARG